MTSYFALAESSMMPIHTYQAPGRWKEGMKRAGGGDMVILNLVGLQGLISEMELDQRLIGVAWSVTFEVLFQNCRHKGLGELGRGPVSGSLWKLQSGLHHWCQTRRGMDPRGQLFQPSYFADEDQAWGWGYLAP